MILPKAIRDRRRWDAGTRLVVQESDEGVLLKPAPLFEPADVEAAFACVRFAGEAKTLAGMDAAVTAEAGRRAPEADVEVTAP